MTLGPNRPNGPCPRLYAQPGRVPGRPTKTVEQLADARQALEPRLGKSAPRLLAASRNRTSALYDPGRTPLHKSRVNRAKAGAYEFTPWLPSRFAW